MTKKDYIILADALRNGAKQASFDGDKLSERQWQAIIGHVSIALRRDNPVFNSVKFKEYAERDRVTFELQG